MHGAKLKEHRTTNHDQHNTECEVLKYRTNKKKKPCNYEVNTICFTRVTMLKIAAAKRPSGITGAQELKNSI